MKLGRLLAVMLAAILTLSAPVALADEQWAIDNGLRKTETVDELYQAALLEGGVINLYGITGRLETVSNSFMQQYPGLTVNFYDLTINEILEKFSREYEAGIYTVDVFQVAEQNGFILADYIQAGLMHNYQPSDIFEGVDESLLEMTPFVRELVWWNYNSELYSQLPITSWWDITKPEWNGKFIFMDPTTEPILIALFTSFTMHPEWIEADYERVFGEPIVLANNEPTAAHALINRIAHNGVILETSNTNIVKAVGGVSGMTEAPIGYGGSSKLRDRDLHGYKIAVDPTGWEDQTPPSIVYIDVVQIADKCQHPNGAKLFVRYLCGETDHNGDGIQPFLTAGNYPVFSDAVTTAEMPDFDSVPKYEPNWEYLYENFYDVLDYWISVQP